MANAKAVSQRVLPDEYLAGELLAEVRHEYVDGIVYAMSGATEGHSIIKINLTLWLFGRLPEGCRLFNGDLKLETKSDLKTSYYYPDVFVSCSTADGGVYFETEPRLIFEVLSKTTERNDKFEKRLVYQQIPSLLEYVLVAQEFRRVDLYRRRTAWAKETFKDDAIVNFESIGQSLSLDQIYRDIDFSVSADSVSVLGNPST